MDLARHISAALEATRNLESVLATGDLVGCADLIQKRERALGDFRTAHDRSSLEDRTRCRAQLADLVKADESLRLLADRQLEDAAAGLARSPHAAGDGGEPLTACLDRKA